LMKKEELQAKHETEMRELQEAIGSSTAAVVQEGNNNTINHHSIYLSIYLSILIFTLAPSMFKSLKVIKRAKLSEDGRFLLFDEPIEDFRCTAFMSSILVNEDRKKVFDLLSEALARGSRKFLITGTPGIGKIRYICTILFI
jgi:hypothetical protein